MLIVYQTYELHTICILLLITLVLNNLFTIAFS
jgi:hypothetical protein